MSFTKCFTLLLLCFALHVLFILPLTNCIFPEFKKDEYIKINFTKNLSIRSTSLTLTELEYRQETLRNMTKEAWNAYRKNAWGGEALDPIDNITCSDSFGDDSGRTIIASLSTLKVMGLEEEFNEAKKWVHEQMSFTNLEKDVSVKLTITDYIGGLLSAFALTADETFHQKANEIGEVVKIAFDPKSGLLHNTLNPKRKLSHYNFDFRRWYLNSISAIGHQQPELLYLAALNNDKKLQVLIEKKIHKTVKSLPKPGGLYKSAVDVRDGTWITDGVLVSFDENSKDFYYNHLRSYLLSGGKKSKVFKNFILAMKSLIDTRMIIPLTDDGRRYVTYIDSEVLLDVGKTMTTSTCYLGAMLYLAAESDKLLKKENSSILSNYQAEVFRVLAENITETCHILAENTNTKLLPSTVYLRLTENYPFGDMAFGSSEYSHHLAESYFILWRLTGDFRYQEYAWQMAMALRTHARTQSGGYGVVNYLDKIPSKITHRQQPETLSATFKYLYLTFCSQDVLPLDKWFFNAQGHPLPISGQDRLYPIKTYDIRLRRYVSTLFNYSYTELFT